MNRSTPGLPVHHQLPSRLVHWIFVFLGRLSGIFLLLVVLGRHSEGRRATATTAASLRCWTKKAQHYYFRISHHQWQLFAVSVCIFSCHIHGDPCIGPNICTASSSYAPVLLIYLYSVEHWALRVMNFLCSKHYKCTLNIDKLLPIKQNPIGSPSLS